MDRSCPYNMTRRIEKRGRGWTCSAPLLLLLLHLFLLVLFPPLVSPQTIPTCATSNRIIRSTNTSSSSSSSSSFSGLLLSCSVPQNLTLAEDDFTWQWDKISENPFSPHLSLTNSTSSSSFSNFSIEVECGSAGQYQASYLQSGGGGGGGGGGGTCVYSCQFSVDITEARTEEIEEAFSDFSPQTIFPPMAQPDNHTIYVSYIEGSLDVSLGTCSNTYHLPSGCILHVDTFDWFLDGVTFDPVNSDLYSFSVSSSVAIKNISAQTSGYYVCVSRLPYSLGAYRTIDLYINISDPEPTSATLPSSSPSPQTTPPPSFPSSDDGSTILGLEAWELGVIIANIIALLFLFVCVWVTATYVICRKPRSLAPPGKQPLLRETEEEKTEFLDFAGPSEIPFSSIRFEDLLHKGTFKTVHHAHLFHPHLSGGSGLEVAVKRLKEENSELGAQEMMAEVYMLKSIHDKAGLHPNLVSFIGVTSPDGPACLLLEYMPYGTLDRFLWALKKGPVPEWYLRQTRASIGDHPYHKHVSCDLMRVIIQVAEGMRFLAESGFVHRDLSTRNILLGRQLHIKIGNPGMFHEGYYYIVTEREHFIHDMAPECMWEKRFSLFSDIWSFGILLYKVVTLETNPYPGVAVKELYDCIVDNNLRPQILSSFSNQMYFLLQQCWQLAPVNRPTFSTLMSEIIQLCNNPTQHIILKTMKDESTPGYVSENGQVFLHAVPTYVFQSGPGQVVGGTQRSFRSSADDTVYSRETADSLLYLYSEAETSFFGQETEDAGEDREGEMEEVEVEEGEVEEGEMEEGEVEVDEVEEGEVEEGEVEEEQRGIEDRREEEEEEKDRNGSKETLIYL